MSELIICEECNESFNPDQIIEIDYSQYCQTCFDDLFVTCDHCDETIRKNNNLKDSENNYYCQECWDDNIVTCHHCGDKIHTNEAEYDHNGNAYCDYCFRNHTHTCDWCNEQHYEDDIHNNQHGQDLCESCWENANYCENCGVWLTDDATYNHNENSYCEDCYDDIEKNIHESDYIPDLIFYSEAKNNNDHFGIELEADNGGKNDHNASQLLNVMNYHTEDKIWIKEDGSIHDGFEIVSHPATLDQHLTVFDWENLLTEATNLGYESHNAGTCGLHVHIDRRAFGLTEIEQDLNITKLLLITETHWDNLVRFSRRTNEQLNKWAKSYRLKDNMEKNAKTEDILETAKVLNNRTRYFAINLQNDHTIELRLFRGTLNYNTFVATLQFCQLLIDIVRNTNIKNLHNITWEFIVDVAKDYTELTEYLEQRKLA